MSAINQSNYEQLQNAHHELSILGEILPSREHFIEDWWAQEDTGNFHLGIPSFPDRPALVLLVHAALSLTAGEHSRVLELLRIATEDISATQAALEHVQPN